MFPGSQRSTSGQGVRSGFLTAVSWLIICAPAWVYLVELPDFGRLQNNDYYGIVGLLTDGDSLSRDPARWLGLKSNEHRATLPMLVYALNMKLTHGDNLGLTVYALAVLTLMLVLLVRLLPAGVRGSPWARTLCGLIMALFCYTPVNAHSVAMGFSGTQWFTSNLLSIAAIATVALRAGSVTGGVLALWPALLFGVLGAFTYSTSLLLWPALLAGALYLRVGPRRWLFLAAGATAVYSLFVLSYQPLPYHPEPETRDLGTLFGYSGVLLGSLFTGDVDTARSLGAAAMVASLAVQVAAAVVFRASPSRHAPWLMVQLYAFANALGTAVSRSGFGEEQAMASRYASTAALFWLALATLAAILVWRLLPSTAPGRAAALAILAATAAGAAIPMHRHGGKVIDAFTARASRQGVAALAIRHGLPDHDILRAAVSPAPHQVWALRDFMQATRHVPFDRPADLRLGERIDAGLLNDRPPAEIRGALDGLVRISPTLVRLSGWAESPGAEVEEVLLLDQEGAIRGAVALGVHRPRVLRHGLAPSLDCGWEGYALLQPEGEVPRAYVRLRGDPAFYRLPLTDRMRRQLGGA